MLSWILELIPITLGIGLVTSLIIFSILDDRPYAEVKKSIGKNNFRRFFLLAVLLYVMAALYMIASIQWGFLPSVF